MCMPRPLPRYVRRQTTRHGKTVYYFRRDRGGSRIRLRKFGTAEWDAEYAAALAGSLAIVTPTKKGSVGSLRWLWERYREVEAWTGLAPSTRRQRENIMLRVLAKVGDRPAGAITRKDIVATRDAKKGTPHAARHFIDTMRGMYEWALEAEHVKVDPTAAVKAPAFKKGKGFKIWSEDEVDAYEARWPIGTRQRVWLDVLVFTGLRRGDAVLLGKQHVRNGEATLRTEKSGEIVEVTIPILPVLQRTLDAGPTADLIFISNANGKPFVKESFGNAFKDACKAAGVNAKGKAAHGLRKVGATRCANAGATIHQLMAIFGWRTEKEALVYTKEADRRRLSRQAMSMIEGTPAEQKSASPDGEVRHFDKILLEK